MKATITTDYLNTVEFPESTESDKGVVFRGQGESHDVEHVTVITRKFDAYDDDRIRYYAITAEFSEEGRDGDCELGDLLSQLGSYAGVTELRDITGDGEDWSAS